MMNACMVYLKKEELPLPNIAHSARYEIFHIYSQCTPPKGLSIIDMMGVDGLFLSPIGTRGD